MKTMVISGINLFEGGPLSVFYDCANSLIENEVYKIYRIVLFVHKKKLFDQYDDFFEIVELPKSRRSYLYRLYYEYIFFYKYSREHDIDVWFSIHDITPRVKAKKVYTYCHNPSPFLKKDLSKIKYGVKNIAFTYFYKYLYLINIKKATAIIVQHDWMRREFEKFYKINNIIVARPNIRIDFSAKPNNLDSMTHFIYAAFPRYFKNYEVICEACKKLQRSDYEVWLTIDGSENKYSADLVNRYSDVKTIKWLGILKREEIFELYNKSQCLIFSSKMESWGLPISEYKLTGKDIILVDLPYAYETLGSYDKVMFFGQDDAMRLSKCMESVIEHKEVYQPQEEMSVKMPYASNWDELINMIIN